MRPIRLYLGGLIRPKTIDENGIWHGVYDYDKSWRESFKELANDEEWLYVIDPLDGFIQDNNSVRWEASAIEIVRQCLDKLKTCNIMIANLSVAGSEMNRSIGTLKEMTYARMVLDIPVITVADEPYYSNNPWIEFESTFILHRIEDVIPIIQERLL